MPCTPEKRSNRKCTSSLARVSDTAQWQSARACVRCVNHRSPSSLHLLQQHLGCTSAIEAPDSVRKRRAGRRAWAGWLLWRGPHPYLSQARFAGCSLRLSACLPPSPPSPLSTEQPTFSEPSGQKSNKARWYGLCMRATWQGQASEVPVLRYSERSIRWRTASRPGFADPSGQKVEQSSLVRSSH